MLWMIIHQITQVPCIQMINNAEARGLVYERRGKQLNWCMFGEWTICDQFRKLQSYERTLSGKPSIVVDDSNTNLKGEEDKGFYK